jgi:sulfopyruvate decarboxylase subunit beta
VSDTASPMTLSDALAVVRVVRREQDVVITTMGPAREWMQGGVGPLDFVMVPSSMSQATSLGLGLAMAQPDRQVIVCNGDGSMLMNLGSLVTMAAEGVRNLVVVVFVNGIYEVTGGQPTPGAGRAGVDFVAIARACGFDEAHGFSTPASWKAAGRRLLNGPGPTFIAVSVAPDPSAGGPRSPGPAGARAQAFMKALRA